MPRQAVLRRPDNRKSLVFQCFLTSVLVFFGKCRKKENGYEYAERRYERFVELPVEIEPTKVEATYRNGVLEVRLPKTEEAKGLRVPVK